MPAKIIQLFIVLIWFSLWTIGGILLASKVFRITRGRFIIGITIGLVLQLWFSNWMAYIMPVPYSFWVGALIVFIFGILANARFKHEGHQVHKGENKAQRSSPFSFVTFVHLVFKKFLQDNLSQLLILIFLIYIFTSIGRGLDIFDDFQNLPVTSIMAAGDIPPHFPYDPNLRFGYHYLLLLFSAQLMRLGSLLPWNSIDIARAVSLALLIMLAYYFTHRVTRNKVAAYLGSFFIAFSGGARWLLLILPASLALKISEHITLMGSGISTAPNLTAALTSIWKIEGDGPIKFPFAYANGINAPATMSYGGIGVLGILVLLLITMLARRIESKQSMFILAALFSAYALTGEYTFLIVYPSLFLCLMIFWIRSRRFYIPVTLHPYLVVGAATLIFVSLQGGVFTEILRGMIEPKEKSFHTFEFALASPTLVSAHLGFMNLLNPYALIAGLFETGPILLVLPLLFIWGYKMIRSQQWWEASVAASAALSILSLFIKYTGTAGESANTRLLATLVIPPTLYAVPITWIWLKKRSDQIKLASLSFGIISIFGGLVFFGIQLIAVQKPVLPLFINDIDVQMENRYWNQLPRDAMIFDPDARRVVTVFGRATDAMVSWTPKDSWAALVDNPDPYLIHAAGYDYIYFGIEYWENLYPAQQQALQSPCVKLVDEMTGIRSLEDYRKDFRRLLDITQCQ